MTGPWPRSCRSRSSAASACVAVSPSLPVAPCRALRAAASARLTSSGDSGRAGLRSSAHWKRDSACRAAGASACAVLLRGDALSWKLGGLTPAAEPVPKAISAATAPVTRRFIRTPKGKARSLPVFRRLTRLSSPPAQRLVHDHADQRGVADADLLR